MFYSRNAHFVHFHNTDLEESWLIFDWKYWFLFVAELNLITIWSDCPWSRSNIDLKALKFFLLSFLFIVRIDRKYNKRAIRRNEEQSTEWTGDQDHIRNLRMTWFLSISVGDHLQCTWGHSYPLYRQEIADHAQRKRQHRTDSTWEEPLGRGGPGN